MTKNAGTTALLGQAGREVCPSAPSPSRTARRGLLVVPVVFALWTLGPSLWAVVATEAGARLLTKVAVAAGLFAWTQDLVREGADEDAGASSRPGVASIRLGLAQSVLLVTAAALALGAAPGIRTSVAGLVVLGAATVLRRAVAAATLQARREIVRAEAARVTSLTMLSALVFTALGGVVAAWIGLPDERGVLAVGALGEASLALSRCSGGGCSWLPRGYPARLE